MKQKTSCSTQVVAETSAFMRNGLKDACYVSTSHKFRPRPSSFTTEQAMEAPPPALDGIGRPAAAGWLWRLRVLAMGMWRATETRDAGRMELMILGAGLL